MTFLTSAAAAAIQSNISTGQYNQTTVGLDSAVNWGSPGNTPPSADKIMASFTNVTELSFPLDKPKYYMNIHLATYKRQSYDAVGSLNFYGNIRLPLPGSINDVNSVDWSVEALGFAGAMTEQAIGEFQAGNYKGVAGAVVAGGAIAALQAVGGAGGGAGGGIAGGAEQVVVGAMAKAGLAANRFMTVVFKGPSYKSMQFNWRLVPRTPLESEQIRKIVKTLNNAMAPSVNTLAAGAGIGTILWNYPNVITMEYAPNPKYLMKFKPAVIMQFSANYTPGGTPAFYNLDGSQNVNAPEGIDIVLRTLELEYWVGNPNGGQDGDFTDSNNAGDVYGGTMGVSSDGGESFGNKARDLSNFGGGGVS